MLETVRPEPIRSPVLDGLARFGVRHGFFTRAGGVSEGIYRGLNTGAGSNDEARHVAENRRRIAQSLGAELERLVTVHQVHSTDVVVVDGPIAGERPRADAMVSAKDGLALGVLTADCGPVLFADAEARVVGAAHAGWKGALGGVLEATIVAMEGLGGARGRIVAVLGPTISQAAYEVGPEFRERFLAEEPDADVRFVPSSNCGRFMFDLPAYIVARLERAGVEAIDIGHCTYADEDRFYSYRRSVHKSEPDYGRLMSAILLEEN
ncbi:MAG: peptidoglycan editing factor PgeF [Rhizobiaceae bacterium]|nr:peptidoglycan editing factor PgeF [Rhizobiaceae bacterium]